MLWLKTSVGIWCYLDNWSENILHLLLSSRLWAADYYGNDISEKVECWTIEGHSRTGNSRACAFKLNSFLWNMPFSLFWMFIAAFMHCLQAILKYIIVTLLTLQMIILLCLAYFFLCLFELFPCLFDFFFLILLVSISWNIFLSLSVKDFHLMPPATLCTQAILQWQSAACNLGHEI